MPRHPYDYSLPAFRPSVYSTGLQPSQPYTKQWAEHGGYGGSWFDYTPLGWAYNKVTGQDPYTADQEAVKTAVTSAGASYLDTVKSLGQAASSAYQAKLAADEAERVRKEEEEAATMFKIGGALVLGVTGVVLVQRYRKTGKVF